MNINNIFYGIPAKYSPKSQNCVESVHSQYEKCAEGRVEMERDTSLFLSIPSSLYRIEYTPLQVAMDGFCLCILSEKHSCLPH